jgi:hypothetical protein
MMEQWIKQRSDLVNGLCLEVSRWGRCQDIDLSAQFSDHSATTLRSS